MNRDQAIQSMKDEGKTGAYVSQDRAEEQIKDEHYWQVPGTVTMVCCLVLNNGFTVTAHAACASPENFIPETGKHRARTKAKEQIFGLEAYLLCEKGHRLSAQ